MIEESQVFYSDGVKLDGSFFHPDDQTKRRGASAPVIVVCSGFMGLKNIHPERFSRFLTRDGYTCFGFDYRGFANSEGKHRRVLIEEQVRDIAHALAYVSEHDHGRDRPLVLLGWGMSGGMILEATRISPPVIGICPMNGFYDAVRVQKAVRGEQEWEKTRAWFLQLQARAAKEGEIPYVDPFDIYPLDPVTKGYVDGVLRKNPDFGGEVGVEFADSLWGFAPEQRLSHLSTIPALIAHGQNNQLHPASEAKHLADIYPGPKELYWVDGGHTEWMTDDNPVFQGLVERIQQWLGTLQ